MKALTASQKQHFEEHKKSRLKQMESFKYVRLSCNSNDSPQACKDLENKVNKRVSVNQDGIVFSHYKNCQYQPRCFCQLFGESEKSIKRKGLPVFKLTRSNLTK
ncbi:hypothetical protein [uncultured Paraglaciecola sp.]|uniref:hypothetical protein n=1 Tax=uncultured Paraglaciecola sp. TaxID=1765024 RepID=UPI002619C5D4|nr:hypothetical protein [uncultured Paraglaciecola sp.]